MPSFFFILDTSGSMATRSHPQFSFFEFAKTYIENFIKVRSRSDGRNQANRELDRYFLSTTTGQYPHNIKVVSEKLGIAVTEEIKKLILPYGIAQCHNAILDAFRVLHVTRAQTGIDGVGTGRVVQNSDQSMIILLTDGNGVNGIPTDFRLEFNPPFLGSDFTKEAFRWDQKLYAVVFRIPPTPFKITNPQLSNPDIDSPVIERLCSSTGGRSFSIVSTRQTQVSIDHILAIATQHRIGVRFQCLPTIHFTASQVSQEDFSRLAARFERVADQKPVTNLISRMNPQGRPVTCHWAIPESFFPQRAQDALPPRTAHPVILCAPKPLQFNIRTEIPVDKLELEAGSPVTHIITDILQGRKDLVVFTYIEGSSLGPTCPFGCLRLNQHGNGITLILLPFNFPLLYPLVEEVVKEPQLNASQIWRQKLDSYFATVPYYYHTQMRNCLEKIKVKVEYNSSMSNIYAGQLLSHLNRLKVKAKEEFDQIMNASKANETRVAHVLNPAVRLERITSRSRMVGFGADEDDMEEIGFDGVPGPIIAQDYKDLKIALYPPPIIEAQLDTSYRTPYTSKIEDLVGKLNRLQANVEMIFDPKKPTLLDMAKCGPRPRFNILEELHNMPQKHMGEYESYQQARGRFYGATMRKLWEEDKDKTHAFGNPYKLKMGGAGVDEVMDTTADGNTPSSSNSNSSNSSNSNSSQSQQIRQFDQAVKPKGPPKRRRGPLGIDAFNKYRERRSQRGSSVSSDISDVSSDFGDPFTPGSSGINTPVGEFEDLQLMDMDSDEQLHRNLDEVIANRRNENRGIIQVPATPVEILSKQEILTRKIRIGSIVRQPANHRAFEEIMKLVNGIAQETVCLLIRHAVRESQRFKLKKLTERLQSTLTNP